VFAIAAWTPASVSTPGAAHSVLALAALLALSTIVVALSRARFSSGVRSRRLRGWQALRCALSLRCTLYSTPSPLRAPAAPAPAPLSE
jgi:hypothetical protein